MEQFESELEKLQKRIEAAINKLPSTLEDNKGEFYMFNLAKLRKIGALIDELNREISL